MLISFSSNLFTEQNDEDDGVQLNDPLCISLSVSSNDQCSGVDDWQGERERLDNERC